VLARGQLLQLNYQFINKVSNSDEIRIFLTEDDINLGFLLVEFLESNGFAVSLFRDGEEALKGFQLRHYDFCILDIMLPRMDGFMLLEKIRTCDSKIPIILLSAKSLKIDKIKGFSLGIDDYITKPFDEEELLFRIKAILNRTYATSGRIENPGTVMIGNYEFDQKNQSLKIDTSVQRLTIKETEILGILLKSRNNISRREELMQQVWGVSDYYTGRSLDVFISKIRSYLKKDESIRITTIPTVGYILAINE
jgi:DNA-binding response OmpR family regulator